MCTFSIAFTVCMGISHTNRQWVYCVYVCFKTPIYHFTCVVYAKLYIHARLHWYTTAAANLKRHSETNQFNGNKKKTYSFACVYIYCLYFVMFVHSFYSFLCIGANIFIYITRHSHTLKPIKHDNFVFVGQQKTERYLNREFADKIQFMIKWSLVFAAKWNTNRKSFVQWSSFIRVIRFAFDFLEEWLIQLLRVFLSFSRTFNRNAKKCEWTVKNSQ